MTQSEAILKRLQNGETLTPLDALNDPEIRCMRLSARAWELGEAGHDIEKISVRVGEKTVAAYRLRRIVEESGQMRLVA